VPSEPHYVSSTSILDIREPLAQSEAGSANTTFHNLFGFVTHSAPHTQSQQQTYTRQWIFTVPWTFFQRLLLYQVSTLQILSKVYSDKGKDKCYYLHAIEEDLNIQGHQFCVL